MLNRKLVGHGWKWAGVILIYVIGIMIAVQWEVPFIGLFSAITFFALSWLADRGRNQILAEPTEEESYRRYISARNKEKYERKR